MEKSFEYFPEFLASLPASNEDDTLVVTPADHDIEPIENYHNNIDTGIDFAEKTNGIILIGIQPTYPSTEFGYIEAKDQCVRSFKEKPDAMTAKAYLKSGHYLWNSGIFIFKASTVINAFKTIAPTTYEKVHHAYHTKSELNIVELDTIDAMSFDRGILEESNNIHVINNTAISLGHDHVVRRRSGVGNLWCQTSFWPVSCADFNCA